MKFDVSSSIATMLNQPYKVILAWIVVAATVGLCAPNLTRLAAEGQAKLLSTNSESSKAAEILRSSWPDQASASMAVLELYRPSGLTPADRDFANRLAKRFEGPDHPREILHVLGAHSPSEIAERLVSRDQTVQLTAIGLNSHFVAPSTQDVVNWLKTQSAAPELKAPEGLEFHWTGDAIIGLDYMAGVQTSLDRAAMATVVLLLIVLFPGLALWLPRLIYGN